MIVKLTAKFTNINLTAYFFISWLFYSSKFNDEIIFQQNSTFISEGVIIDKHHIENVKSIKFFFS